MIFKKITIFLMSDDENNVRQFRLPIPALPLLILLLVFCSGSLFWVIKDYYSMKVQMPHVAQLEKENKQKQKQLIHLARRIDE